jgi:hypothetical protein
MEFESELNHFENVSYFWESELAQKSMKLEIELQTRTVQFTYHITKRKPLLKGEAASIFFLVLITYD